VRRPDPPNSRASKRVPPHLRPRPREQWPPENRALPEEYAAWLINGGVSPISVRSFHVPCIHLVLGFLDKPWWACDPERDSVVALEHYRARGLCPQSLQDRRSHLHLLDRFFRQRRGEPDPAPTRPLNLPVYFQGLPEWLTTRILAYGCIRERAWKPSALHQRWIEYLGDATRFWRWLFTHPPIATLSELRRANIVEFLEERLRTGHAASTVNGELLALLEFLRYLQDEGLDVPAEVFRIHPFPQPQPLPRYLTDDEVARLQEAHEAALREARTSNARRNALLDRACFYLLWHGGLRPGELGDLLLEDLDLPGKRLRIRLGKGAKDRTVYLTTAAVEVLRDYLAVRGDGPSRHVFLYRHRPLAKDLIRDRFKAKGDALGIHAYPYRLRHTCATQLLNAGARLETIQYLLGHEYLRTTQVYARVHDATVAGDYYRAMAEVEERVALEVATSAESFSLWPRLLALAEQVQVNSDPVGQQRRIAELRQVIVMAAERAGAAVLRSWANGRQARSSDVFGSDPRQWPMPAAVQSSLKAIKGPKKLVQKLIGKEIAVPPARPYV